MPMTGMRTACAHSYTIRTAIGRMAGPLRPPITFDSFGRRVSTSIAIARNVLTSDTASAPASSAALRERRDVGDVRRQLRDHRQRRGAVARRATTSCVLPRSHPNVMPPSLMFGHEMFSSSAATPSTSDRMRATSTYSSIVVPQMFTMTVALQSPQLRHLLADEPVHADALQADRVQHARPASRRCAAADGPRARSRNRPLTTTAPSEERSTTSAYSTP